ncbi:MAG: hypothetical protein ACT452_02945 [Microthrixaceae bacterium]
MGIKDHRLSIEEADDLLAGRMPAGRDDLGVLATDLASLSAAYRYEVDAVDVGRWAAQAAAHARLIPSDNGDLAATSASNAYRPAPQASGLPKRRIPVLSSIATFVATTVGKTVVAGALVAATTTGGLAATGNLPGQPDTPDPTVTVVDDTHADDTEAPNSADSDSVDSIDVADTADDIDTTDACEADEPDATDEPDAATEVDSVDSVENATDACEADEPVEADEPDEVDEVDETVESDAPDSTDSADEVDVPDPADEAVEG